MFLRIVRLQKQEKVCVQLQYGGNDDLKDRNKEIRPGQLPKVLLIWMAAAIVQIIVVVALAFLVKLNILISLILALSFQIPLVLRPFFKDQKKRTVCRISSALLLTAGILALLGSYGRNCYIESMTATNTIDVDTLRYQPFSDSSGIARLQEESTLSLTEELPVLNGSSTLFPLYSSIINMVYPDSIAGLNEKGSPYRYSGGSEAFEELLSGKTDIVFSEKPDPGQIKEAQKKGIQLQLIPIGAEAFVFFVNSNNPVTSLTREQLRSIYSGEVTSWSELGGREEAIMAFQRDQGDPAQNRLEAFMDGRKLMDPPKQYRLNTEEGLTESALTYTNHAGAIGFSFLYYTRSLDVDKGMNLLAVDDVYPDNKSVSSGTYPLSDSIYCIVVKDRITDSMKALMEWIGSEQGQRLVEEAGYVPNQ